MAFPNVALSIQHPYNLRSRNEQPSIRNEYHISSGRAGKRGEGLDKDSATEKVSLTSKWKGKRQAHASILKGKARQESQEAARNHGGSDADGCSQERTGMSNMSRSRSISACVSTA